MIGRLTSELQHARSSSATRERELRRQLEKKQTTIMDQGLRIRNYEKEAAKHALQQARSDASMSLVLSNVMDGMGSDRGSVTLPSGGSLVSADGSLVADRIEPHSMSNGAVSVLDKPGLTDLQRGPAIDVPGTMDPTPSMLEESLKYVGGLPPMGAALTNPSPHLVPPHQLPRGRAGGDPRDNGRPGSRSSEANRKHICCQQAGQIGTHCRADGLSNIMWPKGYAHRTDFVEECWDFQPYGCRRIVRREGPAHLQAVIFLGCELLFYIIQLAHFLRRSLSLPLSLLCITIRCVRVESLVVRSHSRS